MSAHGAQPLGTEVSQFDDDYYSNLNLMTDEKSESNLRNQRNKSMENILSLDQFQQMRQNQSQMLIRGDEAYEE
jgi:hypothetical protein